MSFSYLGQHELAYLTQKLILAAADDAQDTRREELVSKMEVLESQLKEMEAQGPSERLNELKERLGRLNSTLKGP